MDFKVSEFEKLFYLWPTRCGLIASLIFELFLIPSVYKTLNIDESLYSKLVTIVIFWVLTFLYWVYTNKIPKNSPGKYGFLVSIYCDNLDTEKKFREDFIKNLRLLVFMYIDV
jgi:hypothetical protein